MNEGCRSNGICQQSHVWVCLKKASNAAEETSESLSRMVLDLVLLLSICSIHCCTLQYTCNFNAFR